MAEVPTDTHREREHFFGAAKLIAALTMLSRVLGMVRDMAIVTLGANLSMDRFWTAFTIPNLFRRLFGEGALSAAFIPVFTEVSRAEGWAKARLVLANAAGVLAVILAAIVLLVEAGLLTYLALIPDGWDRVLPRMIMIVLPFTFTVCLMALGSAALNCRGHFAYPAFTPVLLNVVLIAAAAVVHVVYPHGQVQGLYLLGWAVVVAGILQLVGVVWLLRSVDLAVIPKLRPILEPVRRIGRLALPMMIPLGIVQFSAFFDRVYALWITGAGGGPEAKTFQLFGATIDKPFGPGVVTCVYVAARIYMFPLGILGISLATAVFPLLSRYADRGDLPGLRATTNRALRLSLFLGLPSAVGLILLAGPVISLIFRHRDFRADNVAVSTGVLQMYCLGMWAYFANHILLRAFFAQKDTRTPLRISIAVAAANIVLVAGLVFTPLRARAIGLATAVTATANALILAWILRGRWGRIGMRRILVSLARIAVATAALAGTVLAARYALAPWGRGLAARWELPWIAHAAVVLPAVALGAGAFWLVAAILRCPELREVRGALPAGDNTDYNGTDSEPNDHADGP